MDKYEYNVKLEQIKKLIRKKDYATAARIADTIEWYRIKNNQTIVLIADVYEASGRYEQAKENLKIAYDRSGLGRQIAFKLVKVCIKCGNLEEAEEFYDDFVSAAPKDISKYLLEYELAKAKGSPLDEQICILEQYLEEDMDDRWAYELAKLYHKSGQRDKCIDQCDTVLLWFSDGKYVEKAMELKMIYTPLTKSQQVRYEANWRKKSADNNSNPLKEEFKVKEVDVSNQYNTQNIQAALKESMDEIFAREMAKKNQGNDIFKPSVAPSMEVYDESDMATSTDEYLNRFSQMQNNSELENDLGNTKVFKTSRSLKNLGDTKVFKIRDVERGLKKQVMTEETEQAYIIEEKTIVKHHEDTQEVFEQAARQAILNQGVETVAQPDEVVVEEIEVTVQKPVAEVVEEPAEMEEEIAEVSESAEVEEEITEVIEPAEVEEEIAEVSEPAEVEEEIAEVSESAEEKEEIAEVIESAEVEEETAEVIEPAEVEEEAAEVIESAEEKEESAEVAVSKEEFVEPQVVEKVVIKYVEAEELPEEQIEGQMSFEDFLNADGFYQVEDESEVADKVKESKEMLTEEIQEAEETKEIITEETKEFIENLTESTETVTEKEEKQATIEETEVTPDELQALYGNVEEEVKELENINVQQNLTEPEERQEIDPFETITDLKIPKEMIKEEPKEEEKFLTNKEIKDIIKDFIGKYSGVQGLDKQMLKSLQNVIIDDNCNILIMGDAKSGKTSIGIDIIKVINKIKRNNKRKIAKISADKLNGKNIQDYFERLEGSDLYVENISLIDDETLEKLFAAIDEDVDHRIVVIEDEKINAEKFLKRTDKIKEYFVNTILVKQNKIRDWAAVAEEYAMSKGYRIDEMGMLAVHASIDELYGELLVIQKNHVEGIIDNAIKRAEKGGLFKKMFSTRRSKVLSEEHF